MPRTTGRGGSGHSGSGFGGARGDPGSGRGPSGPGDIWAPFRRKDASVPTPMEWIRDWAQGRPNPIRSFSPAKVSWETGRDVFRQARDEPDTEIGRTMRREFAREGVSFGADRAVHFDPAKLEGPGRHLGPEFRRARRLDRDEPAAPPRAPDLDAPIAATPRRPRPRPLDLARRDDPLRGTLLGGGRGPDGPRGSRDTVAESDGNDRPETTPPSAAPPDAKPVPPAAKPADITAPGAPLDRDGPVYGYVSDDEGGQKLDGYVPPAGKSGATVGTGVDLGQRDADDIRKLDIPPELAEKLVPYAGHKRADAQRVLDETPLEISEAEAEALDAAVWQDIAGKVERDYDRATEKNGTDVRFADLPGAVQAGVMTIAYVSGDDLKGEAPKFWGHVTSQDWRAAAAELKDFGFATEANNGRASDAGDLLNDYLDGRGGGRPRR